MVVVGMLNSGMNRFCLVLQFWFGVYQMVWLLCSILSIECMFLCLMVVVSRLCCLWLWCWIQLNIGLLCLWYMLLMVCIWLSSVVLIFRVVKCRVMRIIFLFCVWVLCRCFRFFIWVRWVRCVFGYYQFMVILKKVMLLEVKFFFSRCLCLVGDFFGKYSLRLCVVILWCELIKWYISVFRLWLSISRMGYGNCIISQSSFRLNQSGQQWGWRKVLEKWG